MNLPWKNSITYFITRHKDAHPTVCAEETADTLNTKLLYFNGKVADDFSSRLNFQNHQQSKERDLSKKDN